MKNKTNKTPTFPLLQRLDTINIDDREEGEMLQLEERDPAEGTASALSENIKR
jgi:hypothetical protein